MTNSFLEDQAKARGMTVSEMMRERGKKANKSKSGFASLSPQKRREISQKGLESRWGKKRQNGLESSQN